MANKPARITVLLTPADFAKFDAFCASRGHKKSTLIARLIREHLRHEGFSAPGALFPPQTRPRQS